MGLFGNKKSTETVKRSVKLVKDETGAPKVSLEKIASSGGVSLSKSAESANTSLQRAGLAGIRADMVVLLDHSGSMGSDYRSGAVQQLVEKALAYGLQFDDQIEVIPFDYDAKPEITVTLSNYVDVVNREVRGTMGSTNLTAAFEKVKKRAEKATQPIYCCVITDGNPDDKRTCSAIVCELAGYPVFIKFLALREVPYLQELDDLGPEKRLLDNVDAKFYSDLNISDDQFAADMADEWASWIKSATDAGVLTN